MTRDNAARLLRRAGFLVADSLTFTVLIVAPTHGRAYQLPIIDNTVNGDVVTAIIEEGSGADVFKQG